MVRFNCFNIFALIESKSQLEKDPLGMKIADQYYKKATHFIAQPTTRK